MGKMWTWSQDTGLCKMPKARIYKVTGIVTWVGLRAGGR